MNVRSRTEKEIYRLFTLYKNKNMEYWEKFEKLIEILGQETVLREVTNYFTSDQIDEFCDSVANDYDIENEFNEE